MRHINVHYSQAGDQLKVYWDDAPSYAEEPEDTNGISFLKSLTDLELTGIKIWDFSKILQKVGLKLVPITGNEEKF